MDEVISFTVPSSVDVPLRALLYEIPGVDVNAIDIAPVFWNILEIKLNSFVFDVPSKEISIEMFLNKVAFYENLLSIKKYS